MADILHRITIDAPRERVHEMIATKTASNLLDRQSDRGISSRPMTTSLIAVVAGNSSESTLGHESEPSPSA